MLGTIGMRTFFKARHTIFVFMAMLFASACQPLDSGYVTNGIGADLSAPKTAKAERAQLTYFNYLCRQSGVGSFSGGTNCISGLTGSDNWTQLTYQGLNDIDRRCDGYLEWLDNKKRSRGPLVSQIGSVEAATIAVLGATNAATQAITIVGQAFELLTQSVENYHSRLLLEVDQRTINTIVLQARHKFREDFSGKRIANKPQSEYVLRSYLRICLPFAIESVINGNATLVALGVRTDEAGDATIHNAPVLNQATGRSFRESQPKRGSVERVVVTTPPPRNKFLEDSIELTSAERSLPPAKAQRIQNALCIGADGVFGAETREATRMAKLGLQLRGTGPDFNVNRFLESDAEIDFFARKSGCGSDPIRPANAFEKYYFQNSTNVKDFQESLSICLATLSNDDTLIKAKANTTGILDSSTRKSIETVRQLLEQNDRLRLNEPVSRSTTRLLVERLSPCQAA